MEYEVTYQATPELLNIFLIAGAILAVLIVLFFVARYFTRKAYQLANSFNLKVIQVTLPKEKIGEKNPEMTLQKIQEEIAVGETFFSGIGGLKAQKGIKAWFFGRTDHFSFEIVAHEGLITFYVAVNKRMQAYTEQQILAQYPHAQIEEIEDYNVFHAKGAITGNYIVFKRPFYLPIKTYKKFEADPLNAVTNMLSKLEGEDSAVIQIIVRSARRKWHKAGKKLASKIQQGKSAEKAMGESKFLKALGEFKEAALPQTPKPGQALPKTGEPYRLSPMESEMIKGLEEKTSKAGMDVNIRIIVSSPVKDRAEMLLENINNVFNQYNIYEYGNSFKVRKASSKAGFIHDFIYRNFKKSYGLILNTEEMASVFHFPLPSTETPNIRWLEARKAPSPVNIPKEGLILGENTYRGVKTNIRIKDDDRRRHMYIIGQTGTGKSWLMANMARQDIINGKGVCIIDPHGDLIEDIITAIPKERAEDVIYFNPADFERPMGLNLLEYDPDYPEQKTFLINEMINIFDKLYDLRQTGGPIFEQYMRNSLLLIMDHPESGSTLMEVPKVLADPDFRAYKLSKTHNEELRHFWKKEAEKAGGEAALANVVPYITSKLTQFVSNEMMRLVIGQQKSAFNFRKVMDEGKILLVKLSKGKIGDMNAYLLGMVLVGRILMAALSRTDMPKEQRKDFYLYIDEFQNFTTDSIAIILSEARKYMLNLIIANQFLGQLVKGQDTRIKDAVFGNVGTMVSFRIGVEDAEFMAKQFAPVFGAYDLINIPKFNCYIKLLIENSVSRAFNMKTPVLDPGDPEIAKAIIELSRLKYGRNKNLIEEEIKERVNKVEKEMEGVEEEI